MGGIRLSGRGRTAIGLALLAGALAMRSPAQVAEAQPEPSLARRRSETRAIILLTLHEPEVPRTEVPAPSSETGSAASMAAVEASATRRRPLGSTAAFEALAASGLPEPALPAAAPAAASEPALPVVASGQAPAAATAAPAALSPTAKPATSAAAAVPQPAATVPAKPSAAAAKPAPSTAAAVPQPAATAPAKPSAAAAKPAASTAAAAPSAAATGPAKASSATAPAKAPAAAATTAKKTSDSPAVTLPPAPSSTVVVVDPAADRQPDIARNVRVEAGGRFEVPFEGTGWTYLGEKTGSDGVSYESRRFEGASLVFVLYAARSGDYVLRFQRQDSYAGTAYEELVGVTATPRPAAAAAAAPAASAAGSAPAGAAIASAGAAGSASAAAPAAGASPGAAAAQPAKPKPVADTPEALALFAKGELAAGRAPAAIEALDAFLSRFPSGTDEVFFLYAQALEQNGPSKDIRRALELYKKVRDGYPQSPFWDKAAERASYIERRYFEIR